MTRDEQIALLNEQVKTKNLIKHCLACEAVMRGLARHFGEDEYLWGSAGLMHDVDYDQTVDKPDQHTVIGADILRAKGIDERAIHAMLAHNDKAPRENLIDKALYATDPTTGMVVAAALIRPEKKLAIVDVEFIVSRMKEKGFARAVNRDQMRLCSEIGLSLEEFLQIALDSMQAISKELGL
jgi:putative nucleotidyltransferase with HDIG domain